MAISIVRLGTPRKKKDLRIGTVRRPPRGVKKSDFSRLDYYDVWLPLLSPDPELIKLALTTDDAKSWNKFKRKFKSEMKAPAPHSVLELLAAMSHQMDFSLGCYCEKEERCHRSILRELLSEMGANIS